MRFSLALLLLLAGAVQAQVGIRYYLHPECAYRLTLPQTWKVKRNVSGVDLLRSPSGAEIRVPRATGAAEEPGFTRVELAHGYVLDVRYGANRKESEAVLGSLEFMQPVCGGHP